MTDNDMTNAEAAFLTMFDPDPPTEQPKPIPPIELAAPEAPRPNPVDEFARFANELDTYN